MYFVQCVRVDHNFKSHLVTFCYLLFCRYSVVQRSAAAGSVALASYCSATDSTDVRLPLGDALIFVVAQAAIHLFLESPNSGSDSTAKEDKVMFTADTQRGGDVNAITFNRNESFVGGPGFATAVESEEDNMPETLSL